MATPITPSEPKHFRIHQSAITFGFNDLGDANNVAISVYTNAKVSAYIDGIIPLTPSDEARQWTLTAFSTHFTDDIARYCHIAISREGSTATLVFPSTRLDLYGRPITDDATAFLPDGSETLPPPLGGGSGVGADPDHYFLFLGKITAAGAAPNGGRDWASISYPICGILDTIRYWQEETGSEWNSMFQFDDAKSIIRVLKPLVNAQFVAPIKLLIGSVTKTIANIFRSYDTDTDILPAGIDPDTLAAKAHLDTVLPTEQHMRDYGEQHHLSRLHDDTAQGNITFSQDISVLGDATIHGTTRQKGPLYLSDTAGADDYNRGINGWRIDHAGNGELNSLRLREFLETPELRYNRITVQSGVNWSTFAGGILESVTPLTDTTGIATIKLEDGEAATIAPNDLCMGIFHFEGAPTTDLGSDSSTQSPATSGGSSDGGDPSPSPSTPATDSLNSLTSSDDRNGNFQFRGFATIYFRVIAICDQSGNTSNPDSRNRHFIYELRLTQSIYNSEPWPTRIHPQPSMSFAAYANTSPEQSDPLSRQSCRYSTTEYSIALTGMNDWIYNSANIQYIEGMLEGFTFEYMTPDGELSQYPLHGFGIATGNIYKWGNETTLDRPALPISQQLLYCVSALSPDQFLAIVDGGDQLPPPLGGGSGVGAAPIWQHTPLSPTREEPYVYARWRYTYVNGPNITTTDEAPFLFSTFGAMGESAITPIWTPAVTTLHMRGTGWIENDEPEILEQIEPTTHITATLSILRGATTPVPIQTLTPQIPDDLLPHISNLTITPAPVPDASTSGSDGGDTSPSPSPSPVSGGSAVAFDISGITTADPIIIPFIADLGDTQVVASLYLSPIIDGSNGISGDNGIDATIYEIEPTTHNFIVDPDELSVITPSITFRVFRIDGNAPRQPLRGFYYRAEFLDQEGAIIPEIPVLGQYSQDPEVTIALSTSLYQITMAEILHYIKFSVLADDQTEIKTVTITRVNAGEQGPQGIPGSDAITYTLEPTADAYRTNTAGSATESWGATLYRSVGTARTPHQQTSWTITLTYDRGMATDLYYTGSSFSLTALTIGMAKSIKVTAADATTRVTILSRTYYPTPYGPKGEQGLQGLILRPRGRWSPTEQYVNQSNTDGGETLPPPIGGGSGVGASLSEPRYIDYVIYTIDGIPHTFLCRPTPDGEVNINHLPTDNTYWRMADEYKFIATDVLLATNAYIKFGQNNQLLIVDADGETIIGGFSGFATDSYGNPIQNPIRLWVGATDPTDAPFHVKHDGTLTSANVNSEFQDLSGLASEGYQPISNIQTIDLTDIRFGNPLFNQDNQPVPIKPRVYNIIANHTCVSLPTDPSFIGQRVLICNTDDFSFDKDAGTQVVQSFEDDDPDSFSLTFCGAGLWARNWTEIDVNGNYVQTGERYVSATAISFLNGTMEFVAIPYVHKGRPCCRWSLITDGTCIKWFAYEYHLVGTGGVSFDWHAVMNYNN